MSDKSTQNFHEAKQALEHTMLKFKEAAEADERDVQTELIDVIFDTLGSDIFPLEID